MKKRCLEGFLLLAVIAGLVFVGAAKTSAQRGPGFATIGYEKQFSYRDPKRATYEPVNLTTTPVAPGIDTQGWGVFRADDPYSNNTEAYIHVWDYNGISDDGSSHTVVMVPPSGSPVVLEHRNRINEFRAGYGIWINGSSPQTGTYTFHVTDPDAMSAQIAEIHQNSPLPSVNHGSINVTANGTSPTISWTPLGIPCWYRANVFDESGELYYFTGWTRDSAARIPPGVLSPSHPYRCRINACACLEDPSVNIQNLSFSNLDRSQGIPFTTGPTSEDPFISFELSPWQSGTSCVRWTGKHLEFQMSVYDAQGVPENIDRVEVVFPGGTTLEPLAYRYGLGPQGGVYMVYALTQEPISGTYTFHVYDKDGHSFTRTQPFTYNPMEVPVWNTSPADNAVITGDTITFDWPDISGAEAYYLEIYDKGWNYYFGKYLADSQCTIPRGILKEKETYKYWIAAFRDNSYGQNRVSTCSSLNKFFLTPDTGGTIPPVIGDHGLILGNSKEEDYSCFIFQIKAYVEDPDGLNNVQEVIVQSPGGQILSLNEISPESDTVARYKRIFFVNDPFLVESGTYTLTARDFDGNLDTVTRNFQVDPLPPLTDGMTWPDHQAVIGQPVTLSWDAIAGASQYRVELYEGILPQCECAKKYYNIQDTFFQIPESDIENDHFYRYRITAVREEVDYWQWNNVTMPHGCSVFCPLFFVTDTPPLPVPDIKANGLDGPLFVTPSESVDISISLDPGDMAGVWADWWSILLSSHGTFPLFGFQAPLFELPDTSLFSVPWPMGWYIFLFGLDDVPDGAFELDWYDYVIVVSQPAGAQLKNIPNFDDIVKEKLRELIVE